MGRPGTAWTQRRPPNRLRTRQLGHPRPRSRARRCRGRVPQMADGSRAAAPVDARDGFAPDQALDHGSARVPGVPRHTAGIETMADNLANAKNAMPTLKQWPHIVNSLGEAIASVLLGRAQPQKRWTRPHRKPMRCSPSPPDPMRATRTANRPASIAGLGKEELSAQAAAAARSAASGDPGRQRRRLDVRRTVRADRARSVVHPYGMGVVALHDQLRSRLGGNFIGLDNYKALARDPLSGRRSSTRCCSRSSTCRRA